MEFYILVEIFRVSQGSLMSGRKKVTVTQMGFEMHSETSLKYELEYSSKPGKRFSRYHAKGFQHLTSKERLEIHKVL